MSPKKRSTKRKSAPSSRTRKRRTKKASSKPASGEASPSDDPERALKAPEAAALLGIGERKLWALTNMGSVPFVRIGRAVVYRRRALLAWLERHESGGEHTVAA